jgi:hypothetical protein
VTEWDPVIVEQIPASAIIAGLDCVSLLTRSTFDAAMTAQKPGSVHGNGVSAAVAEGTGESVPPRVNSAGSVAVVQPVLTADFASWPPTWLRSFTYESCMVVHDLQDRTKDECSPVSGGPAKLWTEIFPRSEVEHFTGGSG